MAIRAMETGFNPDYHEEAPSSEDLSTLKGVAFIEFGAPWCAHCQAGEPAIRDVLSKHAFPHIKVYDGKGKRLGRAFKVKLWPTLIRLQDGIETGRVVRPTDAKEVQALLDSIS